MFDLRRNGNGTYSIRTYHRLEQIIDHGVVLSFIEGISIQDLDKLRSLIDQHLLDDTLLGLERMGEE